MSDTSRKMDPSRREFMSRAGATCAFIIAMRGLISISPRLPITTMRPLGAAISMSEARFTLASISRMRSGPLPPDAATTLSR